MHRYLVNCDINHIFFSYIVANAVKWGSGEIIVDRYDSSSDYWILYTEQAG